MVRRSGAVIGVAFLLVVAACNEGRTDQALAPTAAESTTTTGPGARAPSPTTIEGTLVRVMGTVEPVDDGWVICPGGHGPCWALLGAIDPSAGWAIVEGSYADRELQVRSVETATDQEEELFPNPCPDMAPLVDGEQGGVAAVDGEVQALRARHPDQYAATWFGHPGPVLVVGMTDDADAHQASLAARGVVGVCVTDEGFAHTHAELQTTVDQVEARRSVWDDAGWRVRMVRLNEVENRVGVHFDRVDHRLVDEVRSTWGDRVEIDADIEVLEGSVDDLAGLETLPGPITLVTTPPGSASMDAGDVFVLRHDEEIGCIYLERASGADGRVLPIWPFGYSTASDPLWVLDDRGARVAQAGDPVGLGGGSIPLDHIDTAERCGADDGWGVANR